MRTKVFVLFMALFLIVSCAPKIYSDPQAKQLSESHHSLAVLPPKVFIEVRKKDDPKAIQEQEKKDSDDFQREMYSWLLKRKSQGKITTEIQDVQTTISKLKKAGYYKDPELFTAQELAKILGVDAVLASKYSLSRPMSQGAAIAAAVLVGFSGNTNEAVVDLNVYDGKTGKMIWSYNHKAGGSFTNSNRLVDALMRNASKKMPHVKE
ncbi:hypothetical protein EDM00_07180 [Ornithobacterium rhinotracheale]|uniref:hypothetical protein n=1 Tax=Ornithobacterium rhinotracheale TaxID=28251 RepID=UPI00129C4CC9|nr:hypothetical protein [Ornithobacterium rhinotracheale]MRI63772.1 hypothetical protein [Ornithobacterium rhinotracheale]